MISAPHTSARALLLAVLASGAALAVPATARAQSVAAEQALLNRLDATPPGIATTFTHAPAATAAAEVYVDGDRALLNRSRAVDSQLTRPETGHSLLTRAPDVDGVRALLNRSSS